MTAPDLEFSIVTAVYNVGRYLDEFIESIEAQTFPRECFEVIAVDDGSTDDSLDRLRAWAARRPDLVTVITKANGGQSTARNAGLPLARAAWVTFADPDDVLQPGYLAEVAAFIREHPTVDLIATNRLILNDATGEASDAHPLRRHFAHGNRVRDITDYPDYFHGSAPAAFFPLDEVRRQELRFDPRVAPNWEDGHFCSRYLLGLERPTIGFVASAHYLYRKRADVSSTLQGSLSHRGRYTDVLRFGFLDALRRGADLTSTGMAPEWLQNFVLYELSWYFSNEEAHAGAVSGAIGPVADEFHDLMRQILALISKDVINGFMVRSLKPAWAEILLHGYDDDPWHQSYGHVARLDPDQGLVKITYRYIGRAPDEELLSGGRVVEPRHAKIRDIAYHSRVLLRERIVWMSARQSVRVRLNGHDLDLQFSVPRRNHTLRPGQIRERLDPRVVARRARARATSLGNRLIRRLARFRPVRRYFRNAWVLMDRISDAGDSAERLFAHLRHERPDVNAFFVVATDSPDWRRLRRSHGRRLLAHGSLGWKLAMANCRHLISSHVDVPVVQPPAVLAFTRPAWRFTFLQHGVIKDDLSAWLNPKPIDLFITSTSDEFASIAADHTPYVFTTKEVRLTGLPRFDRLREISDRFDLEGRDLILVAPTWRVRLVRPLRAGEHRRAIEPAFLESDFARNWMGLVGSPELAEACAEQNLTVGFLPHPVLQPALPLMQLPSHVRAFTFADNDVQELFARAAVMVTDYSSMAFNAAYINRPLVYFQFDADQVRGGEHLGRRGYFDYERDGFGPVAYTLEQAVNSILAVLRTGRNPSPDYQARIDAAFPLRDGRCCERVVQEIEELTRRLTPDEAAIPTPPPQLPSPLVHTPTR